MGDNSIIQMHSISVLIYRDAWTRMVRGLIYLHELIAPWLGIVAAASVMLCLGGIALAGTNAQVNVRRLAAISIAAGIWSTAGLIAGALIGEQGGIDMAKLDTEIPMP